MRTIYTENKRKILQNRAVIEKKLGVEINFEKNNMIISGEELNEYIFLRVFEAIELGFTIAEALLLVDENYVFEKINIKDISRRKNLAEVRARVIGTFGRTLKTMCELSKCEVVLHDNIVGVIGKAEDIEFALTAMKSLIRGSKQANVYSYLEKSKELIKGYDDLEVMDEGSKKKSKKNKF